MTTFELCSLIAYFSKIGAILWGLWLIHVMDIRRDKQIDQQGKSLEEIALSLREQSAGIRALLECSQ